VTDAMVKSVAVAPDRRVTGVTFVDRTTGADVAIDGRVVVLAASACETARILLNSKSQAFPTGLANSSGQVGRNLMDSTGVSFAARIPGLEGRPRYNEDGNTSNHLFIPWWGHAAQARGELNFARGYHFEFGGGFNPPNMGIGQYADGYGLEMKRSLKRRYGSGLGFALRGEMLPNEHCYMEIDDDVRDRWGIPVVKFHWQWSDQELNQAVHGMDTVEALVATAGGEVLTERRPPEEMLKKGGEIIHEVGTTRMGNSPTTSVTNQYGQTWDCPNLFVMDGGVFASNPHKNCTLTLMTLAMRSSDWLAGELERGTL
jgi:choline dehydrogenase-like flavoprotein